MENKKNNRPLNFAVKQEYNTIYFLPVTSEEDEKYVNKGADNGRVFAFSSELIEAIVADKNDNDIIFPCPITRRAFERVKEKNPGEDWTTLIFYMCDAYTKGVTDRKIPCIRFIYNNSVNAIVVTASDETEESFLKADKLLEDYIASRMYIASEPVIDEEMSRAMRESCPTDEEQSINVDDPIEVQFTPFQTFFTFDCSLGFVVGEFKLAYKTFRKAFDTPFTLSEKEKIKNCFKGECIVMDNIVELYDCDRAIEAFSALVGISENTTKEEFEELARRWNTWERTVKNQL